MNKPQIELPVQTIASISIEIDPEFTPVEREEALLTCINAAVQHTLGEMRVPETQDIVLNVKHEDGCPAAKAKGGDFLKCTCETLIVDLGAADPETIKVAASLGAISRAGDIPRGGGN